MLGTFFISVSSQPISHDVCILSKFVRSYALYGFCKYSLNPLVPLKTLWRLLIFSLVLALEKHSVSC